PDISKIKHTILKVVDMDAMNSSHTVPTDFAVEVEVKQHQVFWTCDNKPFNMALTTVPPHADSLVVSTKTKVGLVTEDDPCHSESLQTVWHDTIALATLTFNPHCPDPQTAASPEAGSRKRGHRKRCARPQKRGKRAGVRTRLTSKPARAALPSILLSNVCSLENKLDCIRLQRTTRRESRDCCVFVFTETWLSDSVPDAAIQLDGLASFRADRDSALCGKTRGGGLCVYISTEWCKNSVLVSSYCSPLVEFMVVRCRPFYLPREFTAVLIISVYIPPGATAKAALCELYSAISGLQNTHPDGLFIVAGDFNHVNLKSVLPKFHQHVNFATRGANALDLVYTNIPSAYRAEPRPHLGYSDHISVMLIPAYRPLVRRSKPVLKQVRTWPSGAISALQDCFEHTDWQMFREAATYSTTTDLEEYTSSVTSYIGKCIDDVTVSKTITTRPNQKPWMTAEVRALLKARDSAFKEGDKAALRKARAKLSRGIREAKRAHGQSIHSHFKDSGDARRMWQGIQAITNYRTAPPACDSDASLPDALNHFYARFEAQNGVAARKTTPPPDDQVLCLTAADVRKTLRRVNPRKAAGPDNIPARVLRECADQLTDVFTDIFNISLSSATVPTCLKATTIIPVPKKSSVSCLNDYRPIALTPIIMKCFERLVLRHIKTLLPPSLDPQQFAYRPNRSTDDAISTTLHLALTHLDNRDTYVRMLFIDFSSAFNTIIPQHLIGKLNLLGLNTSLSNWILDFLTGRPQSVRIGRNTSSTTTLSTGAPQGCVLSPLLFTLLTHDCAAMHSSNHTIKFADDTTVVGLISKNDESAYREEVQRLTDWCRTNNLSLNVDKTKEMVVDFRRTRRDHSPLHIDGSTVEIVKSTKFLGVHLAEDLTWSLNTSTITKKAQQRLYFLRRLRKAHLPPPILTTFYRGTIESILSSCITAWFGNCTVSDRKSLQRVVRTAEKIIGVSLPTITDIYTTRCIRKANSIVDDHTHPSHTLFTLLPSGKRLLGSQASYRQAPNKLPKLCGLVVQGLRGTWLPILLLALKRFHMNWSKETLPRAFCQPRDRPEPGQELILTQWLSISTTLYFSKCILARTKEMSEDLREGELLMLIRLEESLDVMAYAKVWAPQTYIGNGLDKLLDVGHINVQAFLHQRIPQLGQIWWMHSLTHKWVWSNTKDGYVEKHFMPTVKYGGGSVMVLACFSSKGPRNIVRRHGIMVACALKLKMGRHCVFQQDNDAKR
ncbi:hypothetical protein NFI96_007809, partial [Prochilodus magdalenae]